MDKKREDDIYYVCTMIEYVARIVKCSRKEIVEYLGKNNIEHQLKVAQVNHCLSFEQVADEWIEEYGIKTGYFDSVGECKYEVPTVTSIGKVYQRLIIDTLKDDDVAQKLIDVFSSFISDEISYFNSNVYYSNPDYIKCSYEAGKLL